MEKNVWLHSLKTFENSDSRSQEQLSENTDLTEVGGKSPDIFGKVRISFMILIQLLPLNTTVFRLFLQEVNVECVYYFKLHNVFRRVNISVLLHFNEQARKSVRRRVCV